MVVNDPINMPGWSCHACRAWHSTGPGSGQMTGAGKVPREMCRSCGTERPLAYRGDGSLEDHAPLELVAGLALVDGEMTLMRKKIEAFEAGERAYKAEIAALERRVTELQSRGSQLVLKRQEIREGIAQRLEELAAMSADVDETTEELRFAAVQVRSCAWDYPRVWTGSRWLCGKPGCARDADHEGDCSQFGERS